MEIYGAEKVAKESQGIVQSNYRTWINIYYDYNTDTVMTERDYEENLEDKSRAYGVTQLIRPNTEEEITKAVKRWRRF